MAVIHFLNVKEGDCTWIKHNDGKVTVIDVCNAYKENATPESLLASLLIESNAKGFLGQSALGMWRSSFLERQEYPNALSLSSLSALTVQRTALGLSSLLGRTVNFNQKAYPVNPISYLKKHDVNSIFRFILTHPDMDHMDGIKDFFEEFELINFWDIHNNKEINSFNSSRSKEDWNFYKKIRDGKASDVKRLILYDNARGEYYNKDEQGNSGGNGLYILAPSKELVRTANETGDYNDCSYVILYRTGNYRIVFGGDSHDKTWEYILSKYKNDVMNVDLLIAPHHGRDSDRSYDFLRILNPKLTFFGNANSEYLAHDQWNIRGLEKITNNQGNGLIAKIDGKSMGIFVTHQEFAKQYTKDNTYFDGEVLGWHIKTI